MTVLVTVEYVALSFDLTHGRLGLAIALGIPTLAPTQRAVPILHRHHTLKNQGDRVLSGLTLPLRPPPHGVYPVISRNSLKLQNVSINPLGSLTTRAANPSIVT